jgi:predicted nucleic acid-binding protein
MSPALHHGAPRRYVLDANALIGFFEDRAVTAGKVERLIVVALRQDLPLLMSAVNWGEVFYTAWRRHGQAQAQQVDSRLREMPITVIDVDRDRATRAAALKQKHNLGYADAFAGRTGDRTRSMACNCGSGILQAGENTVGVFATPA